MPRVLTKKPSVTFTVPGEGDIRVWRGETIPDRWYEHVAEADKSAFNTPSSKAAKKLTEPSADEPTADEPSEDSAEGDQD